MRRIFLIAAALAPPAQAAETIAYTYDARGRLVQVARSGSVNDGVATRYQFDKADNRTGKTTDGAPVAGNTFEAPEVGGGYAYNPSVPGVTFASLAGIAGYGSPWGFAAAPDGDQVAFLQSAPSQTGVISHAVSGLTGGASYRISFYLAQRPGYGSNPIRVSFNGVSLGTFTPSSTSFARFTTAPFQAASGSGTIEFAGNPSSIDAASAVDLVTLGPP